MARSHAARLRVLAPKFTLRDDFSGALAAGAVNLSNPTPGPGGVRTVTDGNSKLSIGSGVASFATGGVAAGNPAAWYAAMTRIAGRLIVGRVNAASFTGNSAALGFDTSASGLVDNSAFYWNSGGIGIFDSSAISPVVGTALTAATNYLLCVVLRASGAYYFIKGGSYSNWTLVWIGSTSATASLLPGISGHMNNVFTADFLRVPTDLWLPTPLVYDTFPVDGALTATLATGPDGQPTPARVWTSQIGTVQVSTSKAMATALTGGIAIATVPVGTVNVLNDVAITRGTGTPGHVVRWLNSSNYIYAYHDGTNCKLIKRVADIETTVITAVVAYSAGAVARVDASGTAFRLYYNNALVGTGTISDANLQTGTEHGLYFNDIDSSLDTYACWAKGTENQYAALERYVQA